MWAALLDQVLARSIVTGQLTVGFPDGRRRIYGPEGGVSADITLHYPDVMRRLLMNPQLALGEAYMDGHLTVAGDDIRALLILAVQAAQSQRLPLPMRLANQLRVRTKALMQANSVSASAARVKHHYDIPDAFYALFLDTDMQYTCGYYADPAATLDQAQAAKMDHLAAKLLLRPGQRVLDIGCGWGGLAVRLAQRYGVHVTGVTLSRVQLAAAQARAAAAGLTGRVDFRLQDYRHIPDRFDRVVSVGMMEHVGVPQYSSYFSKIAQVLEPDGVAVVHFIGRSTPPGVLSPWFQKYIFPGGYAPALSEVAPAIETSGLAMADLEVWRGHYARTLRHWQDKFDTHLPQVRAMFDARFVRMWRWYLVASEVSFTHMGHVVFQMQLSHDPAMVPVTRDYLFHRSQAA